MDEFDSEHPFFAKSFSCTDAMTALLRKDTMQTVVDCGGICQDTVQIGYELPRLGAERGTLATAPGTRV